MRVFDDFIEVVGSPIYSEVVPDELMLKYSGVFKGPGEQEDIILDLWREFGFSGYENGLFWLVNPEMFNDFARAFDGVSDKAIAFARTAMGNLFLWDEIAELNRMTIVHLNVHTHKLTFRSNDFSMFINMDIPSHFAWKSFFYGDFELAVVDRFGEIQYDEMATFVPAISIGGDEDLANIQLQKIIPQLFILSQL